MKKIIHNLIYSKKPASALLLTMFILAGMLLVALGSTYVVTLAIKSSGIQAQSTKAYFLAEAGMEKFLWELRYNGYEYLDDPTPTGTPVFEYDPLTGALQTNGNYEVYRNPARLRLYESVGEMGNTKRAVEIEF